MNKKIPIEIAIGVILFIAIITGGFILLYSKGRIQPAAMVSINEKLVSSPVPTKVSIAQDALQIDAEMPTVEKDITNQPVYLIAAYSKNGKNFIDVDYVEWLHGEASIKAQIEDGQCPSASECYDYPNGYKRNRNPQIRTFETSSKAIIEVNGEIAAKLNEINQTNLGDPYGRKLLISFSEFEKAVSKTKLYLDYSSPFKEPRVFITIKIEDNLVTNITEPFQE